MVNNKYIYFCLIYIIIFLGLTVHLKAQEEDIYRLENIYGNYDSSMKKTNMKEIDNIRLNKFIEIYGKFTPQYYSNIVKFREIKRTKKENKILIDLYINEKYSDFFILAKNFTSDDEVVFDIIKTFIDNEVINGHCEYSGYAFSALGMMRSEKAIKYIDEEIYKISELCLKFPENVYYSNVFKFFINGLNNLPIENSIPILEKLFYMHFNNDYTEKNFSDYFKKPYYIQSYLERLCRILDESWRRKKEEPPLVVRERYGCIDTNTKIKDLHLRPEWIYGPGGKKIHQPFGSPTSYSEKETLIYIPPPPL